MGAPTPPTRQRGAPPWEASATLQKQQKQKQQKQQALQQQLQQKQVQQTPAPVAANTSKTRGAQSPATVAPPQKRRPPSVAPVSGLPPDDGNPGVPAGPPPGSGGGPPPFPKRQSVSSTKQQHDCIRETVSVLFQQQAGGVGPPPPLYPTRAPTLRRPSHLEALPEHFSQDNPPAAKCCCCCRRSSSNVGYELLLLLQQQQRKQCFFVCWSIHTHLSGSGSGCITEGGWQCTPASLSSSSSSSRSSSSIMTHSFEVCGPDASQELGLILLLEKQQQKQAATAAAEASAAADLRLGPRHGSSSKQQRHGRRQMQKLIRDSSSSGETPAEEGGASCVFFADKERYKGRRSTVWLQSLGGLGGAPGQGLALDGGPAFFFWVAASSHLSHLFLEGHDCGVYTVTAVQQTEEELQENRAGRRGRFLRGMGARGSPPLVGGPKVSQREGAWPQERPLACQWWDHLYDGAPSLRGSGQGEAPRYAQARGPSWVYGGRGPPVSTPVGLRPFFLDGRRGGPLRAYGQGPHCMYGYVVGPFEEVGYRGPRV
ncbi:hypothetical protein ACSSS7_004857 [Eimeria intestinalis]